MIQFIGQELLGMEKGMVHYFMYLISSGGRLGKSTDADDQALMS
jgi:hypothetical protein